VSWLNRAQALAGSVLALAAAATWGSSIAPLAHWAPFDPDDLRDCRTYTDYYVSFGLTDGNKPWAYLKPGFPTCQAGVGDVYVESNEGAECPVLEHVEARHGKVNYSSAWYCAYRTARRCFEGYYRNGAHCYARSGAVRPDKTRDEGSCPSCGNPINPGTGHKSEREVDYRSAGAMPLVMARHYNSRARMPAAHLGPGWRHTYDRTIRVFRLDDGRATARAYRHDGRVVLFNLEPDGSWLADSDVLARLESEHASGGELSGWTYHPPDDTHERYDADGRLVALTGRQRLTTTLTYDSAGRLATARGPFGRALGFEHDERGRLVAVVDPAGQSYRYGYDARGRLASVSYPDRTPADAGDDPVRRYLYENEALPFALTGVVDENGVRYATWAYDLEGRAILSVHAGGADHTTLEYLPGRRVRSTGTLGQSSTFDFSVLLGVPRATTMDAPCHGCGLRAASSTYDQDGSLITRTDFNGHVTTYSHDLRGLETLRIEATGTAEERATVTTWHATRRLPVRIEVAGSITTFDYDGDGRLLTRTVTDAATGESRTTSWTYTATGLLARIDGPRTDVADVTTFTYDAAGNLVQTANALGHLDRVAAHDPHGRPTHAVDVSGLETRLSYDARGRLFRRTIGDRVTTFESDAVGNQLRVVRPDGSFLVYDYDDARRLIAIGNSQGNFLRYVRDGAGNPTAETVQRTDGLVTWSSTRVYDPLGRLVARISGEGARTDYTYDAVGNRLSETDPNGNVTRHGYDALDRLALTEDAAGGLVTFEHDAFDRITAITDPRGLTTAYAYNAFGDLVEEQSPDRGVLIYSHDDAGNVLSRTDARGIVALSTHDALGRRLETRYPDPAQDIVYEYDGSPDAVGRLTRVTDPGGETTYTYDVFGNITREARTSEGVTLALAYEYDLVGRLESIGYPSGTDVTMRRNGAGQVEHVLASDLGQTDLIASDIAYLPFGPRRSMLRGNGISETRAHDLEYRLTALSSGPDLDLAYTYDPAGNLTSIDDLAQSVRRQAFAYDGLHRLIHADAPSVYGSREYTYDATGNRLTRTVDGATEHYQYDPLSNRLISIDDGQSLLEHRYDAAGNTLSDSSGNTLTYDDRGRLQSFSSPGRQVGTYEYDARERRAKKSADSSVTHYMYALDGRLLVEAGADGTIRREYVYVDDELVAALSPAPSIGRTYHLQSQDSIASGPATLTVDADARSILLREPGRSAERSDVLPADWYADPSGASFGLAWEPPPRDGNRFRYAWFDITPSGATGFLYAWDTPTREVTYELTGKDIDGNYTGTDYQSGATASWTLDEANRTVTLSEAGSAPVTHVIDPANWQVYPWGEYERIDFSYDQPPYLHLEGSLMVYVGTSAGHLHVREGESRQAFYSLTGNSTATDSAFTIRHVHTDHLGTPKAMTDQNQNTIWRADHTPFGRVLASLQNSDFQIRFPGQLEDEETGLHYNFHRYYQPNTGRYLNPDPIGLVGGPNTYSYADGNSIRKFDKDGLLSNVRDSAPIPDWAYLEPIPFAAIPEPPLLASGTDVREGIFDSVGVGNAREKCVSYPTCVFRCVTAIAGLEIATSAFVRKLRSYARGLLLRGATKTIGVAGHVSSAYSVANAVSCTWRCVYR
jgi:RHS repeat-associated protein